MHLHPALSLIGKLFLPSWNFFDDFVGGARFEYVIAEPNQPADGWRPAFTRQTTGHWMRLWFNPWGNHDLLEYSAMEGAAEELSGLCSTFPEFATSPDARPGLVADVFPPSHARLVELFRNRLGRFLTQRAPSTGLQFRFRISVPAEVPGAAAWQFVSGLHDLFPGVS